MQANSTEQLDQRHWCAQHVCCVIASVDFVSAKMKTHQPFIRSLLFRISFLLLVVSNLGCSTLTSLGLPVGSNENRLLLSTKRMLETQDEPVEFPKELQMQSLDQYLVSVGDTLFVETVNFDASIRLPGDQTVKPDGTISLGQFGNIHVVDRSIEEIEFDVQTRIADQIRAELQKRFEEQSTEEVESSVKTIASRIDRSLTANGTNVLRQDEDPQEQLQREIEEKIRENQVTVRLINWDSKRYYILGEVNSPGSYAFTGSDTVLDGILEAGGLTSRANRHQILISRPTDCGSCRIVATVCYDQIVQLGDASTNYQLQPGDRVFVSSLSLLDDVVQSLNILNDHHCPRCAPGQHACQLPEGCR